jgi:hypothetical protein
LSDKAGISFLLNYPPWRECKKVCVNSHIVK